MEFKLNLVILLFLLIRNCTWFLAYLVYIRGKLKLEYREKVSPEEKLERKTKVRTLPPKEYCNGFEMLLLQNGWSDFTDRWTSDLSCEGAFAEGDFRPLCILNFVLLGANQNEDSTRLAPRMTSVT